MTDDNYDIITPSRANILQHCKVMQGHSPSDVPLSKNYFYRPQRSWGKVIFSEACVNNSVHRGGMRGCTGGVCMVLFRGACVVLFGGVVCGFIRGACMVFSVFRIQ